MKICIIAGARPNFMKIAPIIREIKKHDSLEYILVHTGQHYDYEMSDAFFKDLEIPKPDYFLNAGSGSHARQTADIMVSFEEVCIAEKAHETRYLKLAANIELGRTFKRFSDVKWKCGNCGYIHEGSEAPAVCPACKHAQAYFELFAETY